MTDCPDKIEPISDKDMIFFIKITLQDVLCEAISDPPDDLLDLDAIEMAIKYAITLKEKL
jgi:hypothetical protein